MPIFHLLPLDTMLKDSTQETYLSDPDPPQFWTLKLYPPNLPWEDDTSSNSTITPLESDNTHATLLTAIQTPMTVKTVLLALKTVLVSLVLAQLDFMEINAKMSIIAQLTTEDA